MSITQYQQSEMGAFDANDKQLVTYLGLDPSKPADRAAVAVCRHYGFDPLLKHVVCIPKGGVYITRDGLLHVAHQSGQLDGIVVEQEPTLVDGEWVAKVTVYRKDMSHGFSYPGRYKQGGQYAPEMALKAAESHALRRAFSITGLPAQDEQREPEQRRGGLSDVLAEPAAEQPVAEQVDTDTGELVEPEPEDAS